MAGWQMARALIVAEDRLAARRGDAAFLQAKVTTARFFAEHLLSKGSGPARLDRRWRRRASRRWRSTRSERCSTVGRLPRSTEDSMPLPAALAHLPLPIIGAPLFIVSNPKLVVAQCTGHRRRDAGAERAAGRAARRVAGRDHRVARGLGPRHPDRPAAPYAINQIVHKSNDRLEHDMQVCARYKVPIVITSLGARTDVNKAVHAWGGVVMHDVINNAFAHKAIEKGADGLILVAAGAGGHAGVKSPFALVQEVRAWFDGPIALSGAIATGGAVLAAQAMGADFAYIGSAFVATEEARAVDAYKQMIVEEHERDIVYSNLFTGVHGNYLKGSIRAAGLDPENLPVSDPSDDGLRQRARKAWKEIWGCGQGIGAVGAVVPAARVGRAPGPANTPRQGSESSLSEK